MRRFRNAAGPCIRRYRSQQGLTLNDLATKLQLAGLDIDGTTVAKIESRIRSLFDYELIVIARVLKVRPENLFPSANDLKRILPDLMRGKV